MVEHEDNDQTKREKQRGKSMRTSNKRKSGKKRIKQIRKKEELFNRFIYSLYYLLDNVKEFLEV